MVERYFLRAYRLVGGRVPPPNSPPPIRAPDDAPVFPRRCRNFDGGFGCIPGAESHAGQIFTCVGALSIAKSLHLVDEGKASFRRKASVVGSSSPAANALAHATNAPPRRESCRG